MPPQIKVLHGSILYDSVCSVLCIKTYRQWWCYCLSAKADQQAAIPPIAAFEKLPGIDLQHNLYPMFTDVFGQKLSCLHWL